MVVMKKLILGLFVSFLSLTSISSYAWYGGGYGHPGGWGGGRWGGYNGWRGGCCWGGDGIAAGMVGGLIAGSALGLATSPMFVGPPAPVYIQPAPIYVQPAPVYQSPYYAPPVYYGPSYYYYR